MNKIKYILFLIFYLLNHAFFSQNLSKNGKFYNKLFSIDDFGSSAQIWTGDQAENGNVYFGNSSAILEYNGIKWTKIYCDTSKTSSAILKSINRSQVTKIFTSSKGHTYIGREENFGVLKYNEKGKIYYQPLKLSAQNKKLGKIWNIVENSQGEIYFICKNLIYQITDGNKIIEHSLPSEFDHFHCTTSTLINNQIILVFKSDDKDERKIGKFNTKYKQFNKIQTNYNIQSIRGSIKLNSKDYIFNSKNEVFCINKNFKIERLNYIENKLKENNISYINCVKKIKNNIYIGTEKDGLFILNNKFELIRQLNLADGMESVNVFDFFSDNESNIWLNLDNGIHFFEFSSPLSYFDKSNGISERILNIDNNESNEFIATSSGILKSQKTNNQKTFIRRSF